MLIKTKVHVNEHSWTKLEYNKGVSIIIFYKYICDNMRTTCKDIVDDNFGQLVSFLGLTNLKDSKKMLI